MGCFDGSLIAVSLAIYQCSCNLVARLGQGMWRSDQMEQCRLPP